MVKSTLKPSKGCPEFTLQLLAYAEELVSRLWTTTLPEASSDASASQENTTATGDSKPAKPPPKARWTEEHRKNLSEAIRAKWRDPVYRQKIMGHMRDPSCQDKRVETRRVCPST